MQLNQFIKNNITPSKITVLLIAVILIWSFFNIKIWRNRDGIKQVITSDVTNYYCYLPAAFVEKDLTFKFVENDWNCYAWYAKYWPVKPEGGNGYVIKMTMGLSFLYAPFFGMAHAYMLLTDPLHADGFSEPYEMLLVVSSIFWIVVGFVYLRLVLLTYFSEVISSMVMLVILIGTNLYYYGTTEPALSHGYSFSLIAMFIYYVIKWLDRQKLFYIILIGLIGGLITLIRPTNVLILIVPLLYGVVSWGTLKERLKLIKLKYGQIIVLMLAFFIVIFPQLLFWKINAGSWVYFSYGDEGFNFDNPHVYYGLFSYRKGWLLYTPVMLFAIGGLVLSLKNKKPFVWSILVFLPIFLYVVFSWWCWWYGGSFGSRPMVDIYALMALPMGVAFAAIAESRLFLKIPLSIVVVLMIGLNLFQTAQKREGYIHHSHMTEKAYWSNFLSLEDEGGYWDNICPPDNEKALAGEEEYNTLRTQVRYWKERGIIQ